MSSKVGLRTAWKLKYVVHSVIQKWAIPNVGAFVTVVWTPGIRRSNRQTAWLCCNNVHFVAWYKQLPWIVTVNEVAKIKRSGKTGWTTSMRAMHVFSWNALLHNWCVLVKLWIKVSLEHISVSMPSNAYRVIVTRSLHKKNFSIWTRRLAESVDGLNSALAQ